MSKSVNTIFHQTAESMTLLSLTALAYSFVTLGGFEFLQIRGRGHRGPLFLGEGDMGFLDSLLTMIPQNTSDSLYSNFLVFKEVVFLVFIAYAM